MSQVRWVVGMMHTLVSSDGYFTKGDYVLGIS